ncbi:hypothetical protein TSUD_327730 [Trifolium subterraneum]|uniref:Replication factor A C-terminal domain-containing protein n=1 Tax=Trifolium subterraneum TaxID=3900 RepID=A0A2Z6MEX8_TRISU|nr:hypothetical protein TSUD_327730 [Trifolium subterraneum]
MVKIESIKFDAKFIDVADIDAGKEDLRIKVRVICMWKVPQFSNPSEFSSLEMVLIDEMLSHFAIAPSVGGYRPTLHPYKLIFEMETRVQLCEGPDIRSFGFSFIDLDVLSSYDADFGFLSDVIGVLTGVSSEREYVHDGKMIKMIVLELTDPSAKCECALFGDYVDEFQRLTSKTFKWSASCCDSVCQGKASIQNATNATRIYINPKIEESGALKNRLDISGISTSSPVPIIGPRARPSFEDDLLNLYPKKTIKELESLMEEGIFVVCVVIDGFVDVALSNWWYLACKWHRIATPDSGAHYCKGCDKHVYVTIPRFKVKANVFDGETNVVFVIFDGDMQYLIQKECPSLVVSVQGENRGIYPTEFEDLKGVKLLFKSNVVSPIKEIKKTVYSPTRVDEFASGLFESSEALKFAEENLVTPDCDVVDNSTDDCSFDVIIVDDDDSDINVGMSAVKRKAQEGQYWTQRRT